MDPEDAELPSAEEKQHPIGPCFLVANQISPYNGALGTARLGYSVSGAVVTCRIPLQLATRSECRVSLCLLLLLLRSCNALPEPRNQSILPEQSQEAVHQGDHADWKENDRNVERCHSSCCGSRAQRWGWLWLCAGP